MRELYTPAARGSRRTAQIASGARRGGERHPWLGDMPQIAATECDRATRRFC